jgi:hypothetical protein
MSSAHAAQSKYITAAFSLEITILGSNVLD